MKQTKITILDNANCICSGLHNNDIHVLYDKFSEFAPGYRFNPKFKLGSWDGKIRYFHKTGKTYVNLLPSIIPLLLQLGYKIGVDDQRPPAISINIPHIDNDFFGHITHPDTGSPWKFRDYQVDMVNALIDAGGGIGVAGTGAGKTGMVAALALSYELSNKLRTIIIVPDKSLTQQTYEEYELFGLDVGEYSGSVKDINHSHIVSTWQALQHNPTIIRDFDVIIVDECHGARGTVISELLNKHGVGVPYRFGVTGTLPKEPADLMAVRIALGDVLYEIPAHQLIDEGFLAKLHIDIMQLSIDLKAVYAEYCDDHDRAKIPDKKLSYAQFKSNYFPDWPAEKHFFQNEKERLEWMADYITMRGEHGNVFCLTVGVAFGKRLAKMIPRAIYLYGKDPVSDRKDVYNMFKDSDDMIVIANAKIASTGLNIKRIFNMVLIDIGKSFITTIQGIGRGLRTATDKDSVHITDICSDAHHSRRHMNDRIRYYKEAKYPYTKRTVEYK